MNRPDIARPLPEGTPVLRLKRRAILRKHRPALIWARVSLLRLLRKLATIGRNVTRWLEGLGQPKDFVTFEARQLLQSEIIQDISRNLDFDHRAARQRIEPYRLYYGFVPADSSEYHLSSRFNRAGVGLFSGEIVLFPSSHPLLFNESAREFIYDKHHEIPHHRDGDHIRLHRFSFTNSVRPFFDIVTNFYDIANVYEIERDVIYLGGSLNYGHFLTDVFPRFEALVLALRKDRELAARLPDLVIVYCESGEYEFLQRSFPSFYFVNLKGYEFSVIRAKRLYALSYIAFPLGVSLLRRGFAEREAARISNSVISTTGPLPKPRRIYLSREGFKRRRIANEDELIAVLRGRGFISVSSIAYTVEQLAEIMGEVDMVISPMGAHTVNTVFMRPDKIFLELVPASFDANRIWQYNHSLFLCAELRYLRFVVPDSADSHQGGETSETGIFDWEGVVDIPAFLAYLDEIRVNSEDKLLAST